MSIGGGGSNDRTIVTPDPIRRDPIERDIPEEDPPDDGGGGGGGEPSIEILSVDWPESVDSGESFNVSPTISNSGDADAEVTIQAIQDGQPVDRAQATIPAGSQQSNFTLSLPGVDVDSTTDIPFAINVDAIDADAGDSTFSGVEVVATDPVFGLVSVSQPPDPLQVGESFSLDAEVENTGAAAGTVEVTASIDGQQVDSTGVEVPVNETREVTLNIPERSSPGTSTVAVEAGGESRNVDAEWEPGPEPSFAIQSFPTAPSDLAAGEDSFLFTPSVAETNGEAGTVEVTATLDGEQVASDTVDLGPNEGEVFQFDIPPRDSPGTSELTLSAGEATRSQDVEWIDPGSPEFTIGGLDDQVPNLTPGESFTLSVPVTNTGNASGQPTISVSDIESGFELSNTTDTLDSGESTEIGFSIPPIVEDDSPVAGERTLDVLALENAANTRTVGVEYQPAEPEPEPKVEVRELTTAKDSTEYARGETVNASVTWGLTETAEGPVELDAELSLLVNGQEVRAQALNGDLSGGGTWETAFPAPQSQESDSFEVVVRSVGDGSTAVTEEISRRFDLTDPTSPPPKEPDPPAFNIGGLSGLEPTPQPGRPWSVTVQIENTGGQKGTTRVTLDDMTDGGVTELASQEVTLPAGESWGVSLDGPALEAGEVHELRVRVLNLTQDEVSANEPFEYDLSDAGTQPPLEIVNVDAPTQVEAGEQFAPAVEVVNPATEPREASVVWQTMPDQTEIAATTATVESQDSSRVEFDNSQSLTAGESATYQIRLGAVQGGQNVKTQMFNVSAPADQPGPQPDLSFGSLPSPSPVPPGEPYTLEIPVTNSGDAAGDATVSALDQSQDVTVEPGSSVTVTITVPPGGPGQTTDVPLSLTDASGTIDEAAVTVPTEEAPEPKNMSLEPLPTPGTLEAGETWSMTVGVDNPHTSPQTGRVSAVGESIEVTVEPRSVRDVTFDVSMPESRQRDVTVTLENLPGEPYERTRQVQWEEPEPEPEPGFSSGDVQIAMQDASVKPGDDVNVPYTVSNTTDKEGSVTVIGENQAGDEVDRAEGVSLSSKGEQSGSLTVSAVESVTGITGIVIGEETDNELDTGTATVTLDEEAPPDDDPELTGETISPDGSNPPGTELSDAIGVAVTNAEGAGRATGVDVTLLQQGEEVAPVGVGHTVDPGETVEITRDVVTPSETASYEVEAESEETGSFYSDSITIQVDSDEPPKDRPNPPDPGDDPLIGQPSQPQQTLQAFGEGIDFTPDLDISPQITPAISPSIGAPSSAASPDISVPTETPQPPGQQPTQPTPEPPQPPDDEPYDGPLTFLDPLGVFGTTQQLPRPSDLFGD